MEKNVASEKDKTFAISSPMVSPKELLVDAAHHDTICSLGKGNKLDLSTSSERKLPDLIRQTIESPLIEGPTHINSSLQKMPTLQEFGMGFTLDLSKANTSTPTTTSPQVVEMPTMLVSPHTNATSINKRRKSHEKARTSKMSKKKKRVHTQHQDVRTLVSMRSDTGMTYNNGSHFDTNIDQSLPQEISQQYAITNIINPSLYDFIGSQQSVQAATFTSHKTNVHFMQAQVSAKDTMVATTSALAQNHYNGSQMQTHVWHGIFHLMFF